MHVITHVRSNKQISQKTRITKDKSQEGTTHISWLNISSKSLFLKSTNGQIEATYLRFQK